MPTNKDMVSPGEARLSPQMSPSSASSEKGLVFLAVHNSSIGDLVPCSVCLTKLTIRVFTTLQSDPRDLWPLRHLTNKTYPPTSRGGRLTSLDASFA